MKFTTPRAALAVAIIAVSGVAGTALAQSDTASPAADGPGPVAVLLPPESSADAAASDAIASDSLAAAGTPSLWVPIEPYRAFDSRENEGFRLFSVDEGSGALALRVSFDDTDTRAIPANATGVTYNVTIDGQLGGGYLTIAGVDQPTSEAKKTSTINWSGPGPAIANGSSVALGDFAFDDGELFDGYVKVLVGGTASGTEYIIDITGYYIAAPEA